MRVAVFTNKFPSRISTFFARDMRALINAGVDVEIFPFYPPDSRLWRYVPSILDEGVLPKSKVHHVSLSKTLNPSVWINVGPFVTEMARIGVSAIRFGPKRLAKSTYACLKALAWSCRNTKTRYDHILAYWGNYAASSAFVFHRLVDNSIPFSMFLHAGLDLYEGQVFMRQKLLYADNIIVVCEYNRQYLERHFADVYSQVAPKIYKYHLGLDLKEFKYNTSRRPVDRVLAAGSLEKYKGYDYLLRAAAILRNRGVDFQLDVVGDGKEANPLKGLAAELNLGARVRFPGWLAPDDVRKAMSGATIFVHPSNGDGDAVPTVVKEAMALGTPVIASSIAGIPELLDDGRCGVLVRPRDSGDLANAIQKLLQDEKLRFEYAQSGRRHAERLFDLWRNGQQLADILKWSKRQQGRVRSSSATEQVPGSSFPATQLATPEPTCSNSIDATVSAVEDESKV